MHETFAILFGLCLLQLFLRLHLRASFERLQQISYIFPPSRSLSLSFYVLTHALIQWFVSFSQNQLFLAETVSIVMAQNNEKTRRKLHKLSKSTNASVKLFRICFC